MRAGSRARPGLIGIGEDMEFGMKGATPWGRLLPVALVAILMMRMAWAGPKEDTEQAEKEFARGNLVVALSLWKKAADQGYAQAQARMGDMLDQTDDDKESVEWYRKSAAQGNAAGEFGLGQMYAKGEGIKQDPDQARTYIQRAAEKGHLPAVLLMRDLTKNGELGVTIDPVQSAAWDAKASQILGRPASQPVAPPPSSRKSRK